MHVRRTIGKDRRWTTGTSITGWPDPALWRPGRFLLVELKTDTGQLSAEQSDLLHSLAGSGIEVHVWRPVDWDQIESTLTAHRRNPCMIPDHPADTCEYPWCQAHQPCDCPYSSAAPHMRAGCRYARDDQHDQDQEPQRRVNRFEALQQLAAALRELRHARAVGAGEPEAVARVRWCLAQWDAALPDPLPVDGCVGCGRRAAPAADRVVLDPLPRPQQPPRDVIRDRPVF